MFEPLGAVLILVGLLDLLACWFIVVPRIAGPQRRIVLGAVVASSMVLVGLGVAIGWGFLPL